MQRTIDVGKKKRNPVRIMCTGTAAAAYILAAAAAALTFELPACSLVDWGTWTYGRTYG
ncbi:hypothetical protein EJ05DRAFT_243195 [Pseudovirgaria hyperparasitica]|uniref:Uncharacterized protein n=1 Tax=Pseudovirgaria hyperparasitica TaxID=470096 RepID=A0A6A6WF74_9PEZI|nr:uncharacterized protein EJ05DRAFT_243195 [Pseudovirgaria hyperparasitica]KAF2760809.1 hypothetical protein EJ05DRAFT_243195 [Pseudovirgaria hyperparasitica]